MSKRMLSGNQSLLDLLDVYDRRYQARARLVNLHTQEMGAVAQVVRLVRGLPGEAAGPTTLSGDAALQHAGLSTKTRASPRPENGLVDKPANRDPELLRPSLARRLMPSASIRRTVTGSSTCDRGAPPGGDCSAERARGTTGTIAGSTAIPSSSGGSATRRHRPRRRQGPRRTWSRPDNEPADKPARRDPGAATAPSAKAPDASGKQPSETSQALPPAGWGATLGGGCGTDRSRCTTRTIGGCTASSLPAVETPQSAPDANLPAAPAVTGSGSDIPEPAPISGESLRLENVTNLNALARARYPDNIAARNEYRRLMALANPSIFAGRARVGSASLKAGTVLMVPPDLPPAGELMPSSGSVGPAGDPVLPLESSAGSGSPDSGSK